MKKIILVVVFLLAATNFVQSAHATASVELLQHATYRDSIGDLHVIGLVHNSGDVWVQSVQVRAALKDASGNTLDVLTTYTLPRHIPPGGYAGFDIIETDTTKSTAAVGATIDTAPPVEGRPIQVDLAIIAASVSTDVLGYQEVVGVVQNNGNETSTFTNVIALFSTHQGNLTAVESAYTSPADIPPGAQYSFKIILADQAQSSKSTDVTLFAESEEYTTVPEFPLPTITVLAALCLGFIWLRRRTA
jgi:hypothetical protein